MKKVLIITYYWPPSGGSGVQRWVKFSKYLPTLGWEPVIYTPENPELIAVDNSLEKDVPEGIEVIRRHIVEPYSIYRKILGRKAPSDAQKGEVNPINSQKKSFTGKMAMFIRGNFFVPDPRCFWIRPSALFLIKYLKEHPVDAIVSTGPPHSMHLIARKVSLATGIPWIADFRDPWTKMFYFKHLQLTRFSEKRHRVLEKRVLDDATRIVAVSPLVQKDFINMTSTPVELITNGYDDEKLSRAETGFFDVTHTGLFASDGNPETLWKVLADRCLSDAEFNASLRIRLIGKTDAQITASIKDAGLEDKLCNLGYQPHKIAVQEQKNASLLILPLRKEPEYKAVLPGKLFEYLSAGAPILGIGQKDGAMAAIVNGTHSGTVADWDEYDNINTFISLCWNAFCKGELYIPEQKGDIACYSRESTAKQMAELLDSIL